MEPASSEPVPDEEKKSTKLSRDDLLVVGKPERPQMTPPKPPSALLARLQAFLPQIQAANEQMQGITALGAGIEVCRVEEDVTSSSSSSDSDEESELSEEEEMEEAEEPSPRIEIDLTLLKEGGRLDAGEDEQLPEAFRDSQIPPAEELVKPQRKPLIEEMDKD